MNAYDAKKKALENEKKRQLERVEQVLNHINDCVEKGELYTTYYELEPDQISTLKLMGYKIEELNSLGETSYFINWQNAEY